MLHVVTDSTSDLTRAEAERLGVTVVPLTVRFGDEQFRDGVDIETDEFYRRLVAGGQPTTSQPSPEDFAAAYRRLLSGPDDRVLSLHIAQKWSGTVQSATLAARDFDDRVTVIDTGSVSVGIQFAVRRALRGIAEGASHDAVVEAVRSYHDRTSIYVLLDSLTYLQRGGRIGRAQAFLGGVLNVKPLLRVEHGEAHPAARTRSRQQGVARMLELVAAQGSLEMVAVMHTDAPRLLEEVRPRLLAAYPELEVTGGQIGPVVGTYAGPGSVGVAFVRAG